ncbi:MAG TPA: zinc ribbon domain-containing protein [Chloroflexota bacterium]|jgi:putative FmdB family regulatory protein
MPLYEYACLDCNDRFEDLRAATRADAAVPCTTCGSSRVKRLLSVFATRSYGTEGGTMVASGGGGGGCACGGNCACRN